MDRGLQIYLAIFALSIIAALFVMRRREWSWIGLYIGLGCLLASMSRHETWVRMIFDQEVFLKPADKSWLIPWTPSLPMGLLALLLGLIEFYAALGALRRPGTASTAALFVTALYQLTSTAWAIGSWLFDGYGQAMAFGQAADFKLSQQLSLLLHTVLFDIPFVCAIPWGLSRSFQRRNTAADRILERFVLIVGIVLVVLAVIASAVFVAGLRVSRLAGHGSYDAQLYVFVSILVLTGLLVTAIVAFRRTFLSPAISIIESIHAERPVGEAVEPGSVWEPLARSLERSGTELRDARALLQSFIDNIPMALTVTDLSGKHLLVNPVAARHHGASVESMIGTEPAENFAGRHDEFQQYLALGKLVAETGEPQVIEVTTRSAETGKDIHSLVTFFPLFDSKREVVQLGTIATNITELREAERQLAQSNSALHQSEKLAALGQLLAGVSHELNNPLAAVIGQASLLAEDLDGTEHADRVSKIRRAADRCARIVQSFLAMARQKAPEIRSVAINDLVHQAVELTEYQMRAGNVLVDLQLDESLPVIEVDPDQLHQVIVNLLTNARQAMEENPGERRLAISTSRQHDQVKLRIADNGKGIAPEARARIFDPFFSTKDVGSGTGIGLSYSLGIVESHGGKLELEDTRSGTSFAITLPVTKGLPLAGDQDEGTGAQARGRALVIDDEADIADTLSDMLTRMGLNVTTALGGEAGLQALEAGARFELVISDIRMPDVDGPAVHGWIAAHRPDLLDRIVFVTGDTMGDHAARFLESVDCPLLEKPFSSAALRDLVERMLQP